MIDRGRMKQAMPWLVDAWRFTRRLPPLKAARKIYAELFTQRVFTNIYRENMWGDDDSRSGTGSNLMATAAIRRELPGLIKELAVRTILDVPCGDFHWMSTMELELVNYTGADIVLDVVEANKSRFASPNRRFVQLDASRDVLPKVDLILCRDLHIHLSLAQGARVTRNFAASGSTWLAASTYPNATVNSEELTGGCRPVNLELAPFLLPRPAILLQEDGDPTEPHEWNKFLGVWRVVDIPIR